MMRSSSSFESATAVARSSTSFWSAWAWMRALACLSRRMQLWSFEYFAMGVVGQEAQPMRQRQLVLDLAGRAVGHVEEAQVVRFAVPRAALDDVRGDRDRGAAELGRQPEHLLAREARRSLVDGERQAIGQLERSQLRVVSHEQEPPAYSLQSPAYQMRHLHPQVDERSEEHTSEL